MGSIWLGLTWVPQPNRLELSQYGLACRTHDWLVPPVEPFRTIGREMTRYQMKRTGMTHDSEERIESFR